MSSSAPGPGCHSIGEIGSFTRAGRYPRATATRQPSGPRRREQDVQAAAGAALGVVAVAGQRLEPLGRDEHVDVLGRVALEPVAAAGVGEHGRPLGVGMALAGELGPQLDPGPCDRRAVAAGADRAGEHMPLADHRPHRRPRPVGRAQGVGLLVPGRARTGAGGGREQQHEERAHGLGTPAPAVRFPRAGRLPASRSARWGLPMEFRRITNLPPYVFTVIDGLKVAARRAGEDVIDLGFGNPDLPSPPTAVDKLCEAVRNPRNSASRGIPKLRQAVADLYRRRFGVTVAPETEAITTIGAKEGFSHLMWVLLQPGDAALVPSPSYPIHIWGPLFAGADVREMPVGTGEDFLENVQQSYRF